MQSPSKVVSNEVKRDVSDTPPADRGSSIVSGSARQKCRTLEHDKRFVDSLLKVCNLCLLVGREDHDYCSTGGTQALELTIDQDE